MSLARAHHYTPPGVADPTAHTIDVQPSPRRVRAMFNGETVADAREPLVLFERHHLPVYYFAPADVRTDLLVPTDHRTTCPFKGEASYWSLVVGERTAENAVWGYPEPIAQAAAIAGHFAFYWNRVDHWYEEDEEVFVHPRDPFKRIDVVLSHRPVRVVLGGEVVAESSHASFLFETGLPTRYYLPPEDVRQELLTPSESRTMCPYKGTAHYWNVEIGGKLFPDIVWSYPEPVPECPRIKDLLCFYNEKVDDILVEGQPVPRFKTPWS